MSDKQAVLFCCQSSSIRQQGCSPVGMQFDVVSGDGCNDKIVNAELIAVNDVSINETLVQEEGFGGDGDLVVVTKHLNDIRETSGLEVNMEVVNDELNNLEETLNDGCVVKEGKGVNLITVEGANSPDKANFNSVANKLFTKSVNDHKCGKEVEAEGTVDVSPCEVNDQSVERESPAAMNEKEDCGIYDNEEGLSEDKGASLDVNLDECVTDDGKIGKKEGVFFASDLVWGKVKSHPWWPAQIFECGDASDKARKYFNSKGYLVCYFGDQTFAWNTKAKLKPFAPNFTQMVKQTQKEAFRHAVDCVLHEASRRVEFGLSCRCIVDDVYNQLKTQVVENAGIREESRIQGGGDRFFTASSFEPVKFLDYVKGLAQGHLADVNRLKHVIARAQMAAFYRWKGIYHLAEFGPLIGYVNNEADAPVTAKKEKYEVIADATSPSGTMGEDDIRPKKRKNVSSDNGHSIKKVKSLSNFMGKKSIHKGKVDRKSNSSSAGIQKGTNSFANDSRTKERTPSETGVQLSETKPSFRVGESILRVAGQLSQPSPILKCHVPSRRNIIKDEGNTKEYGKRNSEYASLDVVLSELHLAATEPLKENTLLTNMITFISDFRNSIVPDSELLQKLDGPGQEDTVGKPYEEASGPAEITEEGCFTSNKLKAKASECAIATPSDFEASCTNKTIRVHEQHTFMNDGKSAVVKPEPEPEPSEVDGISSHSQQMDSTVSSPQQHGGFGSGASERGQFEQEYSPTALTLKFTDIISIPTEGKLNKIFSHFGPLKESETEVLGKKCCARVVFKRCSDAETAFSSSGKFEIFGPSLVCYQLNYSPSPRKSPSVEAKRRKKAETSVEGNAAGRSILK